MCATVNKANLRDLIAATGLVILLKLDWNRRFFSRCHLEIWWMTPKNNRAPLLCYFKLFALFHNHWWIQTGVTIRKRLIWVKIDDFFERCDLTVWRMTLKNDRAPLPYYFKLCASFRSHWWVQTGVTVRKCLIWVKNRPIFSRMTLQFDGWPWKIIGHLVHATSIFVHHFVAIGEFKPESQSGNAQFGSNLTIFLPLWPWPLTFDIDPLHGHHFCNW